MSAGTPISGRGEGREPQAGQGGHHSRRSPASFWAVSSSTDIRWGPVGGTPGKPILGCFAVMIDRGRLPCECGPVVETVGVNDCAGPGGRLAHRADIHTATPANQ